MSKKNTVPQQHTFDHTNQPADHTGHPARFSRRRLLVTGTGVLVGTLPVLAPATGFAGADPAAQSAAMDQATDRQRRIVAILERHGPELGSGR